MNQGSCPIGRLEKLLLATDTSEFSEGAVREAIYSAKVCSSKLYALTVIERIPAYEGLGVNLYEMEELKAKEHLDSIKSRAASEGVDCEVFSHLDENPHSVIAEEASKREVDMIVIGRRGTRGLAKRLLGEVGAKIIGHVSCDVLVVPRAARITYKHILVATDGSENGKAATATAVEIAKRRGSKLIVLYAIRSEADLEEAEAIVGEGADMARKEGVPVETMTPKGRAYERIVETAAGRGVDLIIMGTYGKSGLNKILMGSSTERVIGLAGCGVLVVK
jgi:nucleotide-binding universal stress UspA family protein